ncbi:MAG: DUF2029 domain-containing protein [Actinobacteria bacterium]|nr:DUF2029 domain-containing protein [Actinomycetota bacterium]
MVARRMRRAAAVISLGTVLGITVLVLALSLAVRQPCAAGDWSDGRQYRRLCYSDLVPLYGTEQLTGDRLPYLNPCMEADGQCDEYPVLTMYLMRVAGWIGRSYPAFFYANATFLAGFGLLTSWALHRMIGGRALYFAAAPSLLAYALVNWDLLAVGLATAGTLAYLRGRQAPAGVLLGLGAAAKLYPAFLVVPFALDRLRRRDPEGAARLSVWVVVAYATVNLPFVVASPRSWFTFFRFNAERAVDFDSLWFVACSRLEGSPGCSLSTRLIGILSVVLFLAIAALVWRLRRARDREFPRWTFGFPLLVIFLLTNKVYSPQYSLWLLPWFGLALPNPWLFGAFSVIDVAVFLTRFTWFGRLSAEAGDPAFAGFDGVPQGAFQVALVLRAAVLMACVVAWIRARGEPSEPVEGSPQEVGVAAA